MIYTIAMHYRIIASGAMGRCFARIPCLCQNLNEFSYICASGAFLAGGTVRR